MTHSYICSSTSPDAWLINLQYRYNLVMHFLFGLFFVETLSQVVALGTPQRLLGKLH